MRCDHAVFAFEAGRLDHPVMGNGEVPNVQKSAEIVFVSDPPEIDRGEILYFRFDKIQHFRSLPEHCLKKYDLALGGKPSADPVQDGMLVLEQHETHAEENEIEALFSRHLQKFNRLVVEGDILPELILPHQPGAMLQIAFVLVDPGHSEIFPLY